jgi:hypothetical protein
VSNDISPNQLPVSFARRVYSPPPRSDVAFESSRLEKNPPLPLPRSGR